MFFVPGVRAGGARHGRRHAAPLAAGATASAGRQRLRLVYFNLFSQR